MSKQNIKNVKNIINSVFTKTLKQKTRQNHNVFHFK